LLVGEMGYPGAEVARYLEVTTSSVNRLAVSDEIPDLKKYTKMFYKELSLLKSYRGRKALFCT